MERYIPDVYQKSIFTIDYDCLMDRGISYLLMDLDNTIAPINMKTPNDKIKDLFKELDEKGFKVIIFSNTTVSRVRKFAEVLNVEYYAKCFKPFAKSYLKVIANDDLNISSIACIGDQLFTDVYGGNRMGMTTVLVNPISQKDCFITTFNRLREKAVYKKLRDNNLFTKGKYYE